MALRSPLQPNKNANQTGNHFPDTSGNFTHVTRGSTRPKHMPTAPEVDIPDALLPDINAEIAGPASLPSVDELVEERGVPDIRPVMLGLRGRLLRRRLDKINDRLDILSQTSATSIERTARFAGEAILTGKGFWPHAEKRRPDTAEKEVVTTKLDKLAARRRREVASAHKTAKLFNAEPGDHFAPDFGAQSPYPSRAESFDDARQVARYDKSMRQSKRNDRAFGDTIAPRHAEARRLTERRNQLALKLRVIDNIRNGRPRDWHEAIPVDKGEAVYFGNPDERGKVGLGIEFSHRIDRPINLDAVEPAPREHAEAIIYAEDATTLYLRGNTIYSWNRDNGDAKILRKQPLGDATSFESALASLTIGKAWDARHDAAADSPIQRVVVKVGNMDAAMATSRHLRHRNLNPFISARAIARQIDADEARDKQAIDDN